MLQLPPGLEDLDEESIGHTLGELELKLKRRLVVVSAPLLAVLEAVSLG